MVGVGTILADDPQLTARTQGFRRPLTRVVLDSHLRTPPDGAFARSAEQISTIIVCGRTADREKAQALRNRGIVIYEIEDPHSGVGEALRMLHERLNAAHVLVEPGPTLGRSMLSGKLVDRVWVIRSPNRVDAASAPDAPAVPSHFVQTGQAQLDRDVLSEYLNPRSDVFFAADQSADFLMASGAMSTATDAPIAPR
jgi:diaminohydroxyphosphoribosylaminopyrimidine deaminase/5-amino-6-(5-phosphoribosylamino)uracil reductase